MTEQAQAYVRMERGDFVLLETWRFTWPSGYVKEYRFGRVAGVDDNGHATGYVDADGTSRIMGKQTIKKSWGIPARRIVNTDAFWGRIRQRGTALPFDTFEDAHLFAYGYLADADLPDLE